MEKVWQITLRRKSPSRTNPDDYYEVQIVSSMEGKTVKGRGSTPHAAYRSADCKLVIHPWLKSEEA